MRNWLVGFGIPKSVPAVDELIVSSHANSMSEPFRYCVQFV